MLYSIYDERTIAPMDVFFFFVILVYCPFETLFPSLFGAIPLKEMTASGFFSFAC